jgi:acylphosphatase
VTVPERVRVHLVVSGRVQGVAFRACTADEARRLGVAGWVRNLPDGRVEAEAEGERRAVEALVAWCRRGPPAAEVADLQVEWKTYGGELPAFQIRG